MTVHNLTVAPQLFRCRAQNQTASHHLSCLLHIQNHLNTGGRGIHHEMLERRQSVGFAVQKHLELDSTEESTHTLMQPSCEMSRLTKIDGEKEGQAVEAICQITSGLTATDSAIIS